MILAVLAPQAHATTSLLTGASCRAQELYLEDSLKPHPDPAYCPDCKRVSAEQFFGIRDLAKSVAQDVETQDPLAAQRALPTACFRAVMSLRPHGKFYHYAQCASPSSTAGRSLTPPCVSGALVGSMQAAFQQTMNCLGVNEKEVFALFGWDSHFQMNLWNYGGVGAGQLTSIAVADIDMNRRFRHDLGKPACKPFEGIFEESAQDYHRLRSEHGRYPRIKPCQWMAAPENPAKNLLYAGATYRMDKQAAEKLVLGFGATPADSERIATDLARYMYNGGLGGVRNVFRLFRLRTHDTKMTHKQFTRAFSSYLSTHYDGDASIKGRVAQYAHHVAHLTHDVEKLTGGNSCSD